VDSSPLDIAEHAAARSRQIDRPIRWFLAFS
jgi:hypothetical protein